ncbi:uncharacterized protein LOC126660428 isoform X2 [Mercurialis annua]|uniref:uncharacterized protein LOC126660428 isoform X2 n=1 Tax=Mercurialis annua TaxID=3986 RepID=UPI00215E819D|nr:uncharacterized protein LOC126660428 isoform X2 [Mercurialis annua]
MWHHINSKKIKQNSRLHHPIEKTKPHLPLQSSMFQPNLVCSRISERKILNSSTQVHLYKLSHVLLLLREIDKNKPLQNLISSQIELVTELSTYALMIRYCHRCALALCHKIESLSVHLSCSATIFFGDTNPTDAAVNILYTSLGSPGWVATVGNPCAELNSKWSNLDRELGNILGIFTSIRSMSVIKNIKMQFCTASLKESFIYEILRSLPPL